MAGGSITPSPLHQRTHRRVAFVAIAVFIAAAMPFLPAIANGFINCDDNVYVTSNAIVRDGLTVRGVAWAFTAFHASNYHPLTWLSHMLDCRLFGDAPAGHHLVNILLHASAAAILYMVLVRLTRRVWPAAAVAVLFAAHPLRVESVAWVAERKDVLSVALGLLTLWLYVGYAQRGGATRYTLALLAYTLGLLAKPMLVTLPLLMLFIDAWPLRREASWTRRIVEKLPFFALAGASCIVTLLAQSQGGAVVALERRSVLSRVATAACGYTWYLEKLVAPRSLAILYPNDTDPSLAQAGVSLAVLLAITGFAIHQHRNRPYLLVGWLWYLVALVPVIGIVQVGQQAVADRYSYLPLIGPLVAIVWLARDLLRHARHSSFSTLAQPITRLAPVGVAALTLALAAMTFVHVRVWKSSVTVFENAYRVAGPSYTTNNNLAAALTERGDSQQHDLERAAQLLAEAIALWPNEAESYVNLAGVSMKLGQREQAIAALQRACDLRPTNAVTWSQLAGLYGESRRPADAESALRRAIALTPSNAGLHNDLGIALAQQGRIADAAASFRESLRLDPTNANAKANLARATRSLGTSFAGVETDAPPR